MGIFGAHAASPAHLLFFVRELAGCHRREDCTGPWVTMTWFSLWLPLLLQLLVPAVLLTAVLVSSQHVSVATFAVAAAAVLAYLLAIGAAGLWLVLPWYTPWAYLVVLIGIVVARWPQGRQGLRWPSSGLAWMLTAVMAAFTGVMLVLLGVAALARRPPVASVGLALPFDAGTFLVVNGGGQALVNAHLATLDGERFTPYRGQSYGLDLVAINRIGLRARGFLPADPAAYVIFGTRVLAPCAGRVVVATDGHPDLPPPEVDRAHMAGNHVILECGAVWVVLGHLQRGSVAVRADDRLAVGQPLGRVGNSGNTGEPHLHLHAQSPGTATAPLSGSPLPLRVDGRYLVRNDRLRVGR